VLKQGGIPLGEIVMTGELRQLLDETLDFVDSRDFHDVQSAILDDLFNTFFSSLQPCFREQPPQVVTPTDGVPSFLHPQLQRITEVADKASKLATLLPVVAKQSHLIFHGLPNEYIDVSPQPSEHDMAAYTDDTTYIEFVTCARARRIERGSIFGLGDSKFVCAVNLGVSLAVERVGMVVALCKIYYRQASASSRRKCCFSTTPSIRK
jgi:Peroxin-3